MKLIVRAIAFIFVVGVNVFLMILDKDFAMLIYFLQVIYYAFFYYFFLDLDKKVASSQKSEVKE